jgi:hypothetical protein
LRTCGGALLIEQNDERLVVRRYLSAESLAAVLCKPVVAAGVVEVSALPAA